MTRHLRDRTGRTTRALGLGTLLLAMTLVAVDPGEPPLAHAAEPPPPVSATPGFFDTFPEYPGTSAIPMGRLEANASPMEMSHFQTPDLPVDVLGFYAEHFRKRGYHVDIQGDEQRGAVSIYDAALGAMVSVTAFRQENVKSTLVFPAVATVPDGMKLEGAQPDDLPRPAGLTTLLRLDDRSGGRSEGSISLTQVARGAPEQVAGFYGAELQSAGWERRSETADKETRRAEYERGGERLNLSFTALEQAGEPETIITVIREGR
ncbi:MAG: hypothetical protein ACK4N5_17600 [Myxococcales bacterium]